MPSRTQSWFCDWRSRDFELRNECLGLGEVRFRLLHVDFVRRAFRKARVGQIEAPLLQRDVRAGEFQPAFERADFDVSRGDVGEQRDEHVVVVFDRRVQVGVSRFDGAAKAAPEVEFPRQIESAIPETELPARNRQPERP